MLKIARLPLFIFVDETVDRTVELRDCGDRIQGLADRITHRFPAERFLGLIFRSGPDLVLSWLAVQLAGKTPCILHYPTEKLNQDYWRDSIAQTLKSCGVQALVHGAEVERFAPERLAPCLRIDGSEPSAVLRGELPVEWEILQLSSGTTGHKKGIRFRAEQLWAHAQRYGDRLKLRGTDDRIVSWLPLYHDMGFIACFVMPLLLGIPVVMMDPMQWVRRPGLLFEAIRRHAGTICYLPNFAFEVLSHEPQTEGFPSMRHWISCSEPSYLATLEKFAAAANVDRGTISTCYAMAENVFAITQSEGIQSTGADRIHASCGKPISGTDLKVQDGEIWVRSPYALQMYVGGGEIKDAEGYYPTGDLGFIENGALVITGRKADLVNIGGRKFLLSDLDVRLAALFRESAGRIASLRAFDERIGTEKVVFLVESERFWENEAGASRQLVQDATGLDFFELHFVPPWFVTKTSSGKINRKKTLEDWLARSANRAAKGGHADDLQKGLAQFSGVPRDVPVGEVLDSLGSVLLRMFCEDHGYAYDHGASLNQILQDRSGRSQSQGKVFSIVALTDGLKLGIGKTWGWVDEAFVGAIAKVVGAPVHFEHLIVPPAPILLSDLIFCDYFMPRRPGPEFSALAGCMEKIRDAGLILVDDEDNFRLVGSSVYPRLDHRFADAPLSDLLGFRFARYVRKHHLLPKTIVPGAELRLEQISPAIDDLQAYLKKPIMRLAFHEAFKVHTGQWEYRDYRTYRGDADFVARPVRKAPLQQAILEFIKSRCQQPSLVDGELKNQLISKDPQHFCSFLMNPAAIQWVVNRYQSFAILGFPWSLPFLEKVLRQAGKPFRYANSRNDSFDDVECILMTGVDGLPDVKKPLFDFMHAGGVAGHPRNVSEDVLRECPFFCAGVPELLKARPLKELERLPVGNVFLNELLKAAATQGQPTTVQELINRTNQMTSAALLSGKRKS